MIQKNFIEMSTHNGIVIEGQKSNPLIRQNFIANNRKTGIKLMDSSHAVIGGQAYEPPMLEPENFDFNTYLLVYQKLLKQINLKINSPFEDAKHDSNTYKANMDIFYATMEKLAEFKITALNDFLNDQGSQGNLIF